MQGVHRPVFWALRWLDFTRATVRDFGDRVARRNRVLQQKAQKAIVSDRA